MAIFPARARRRSPGGIATARALAVRLAELAHRFRQRAHTALAEGASTGVLVAELNEDAFADAYAQTLVYGVLAAHLSGRAVVTHPLLPEFLAFDGQPRDEQDVRALLDEASIVAVLEDFSARCTGEDPVLHFYQMFLQEYDTSARKRRGVFATPWPLVAHLVRGVNESLRAEFGLAQGLADTTTWGEMGTLHPGLKLPASARPDTPFVQILDPAAGTGTFLLAVIEFIHRRMTATWRETGMSGREIVRQWNDYVPRHLLPRLHGYELMPAPFAIAHLKIGLKLHETGYRLSPLTGVRLFLTNALEPAPPSPSPVDVFKAKGLPTVVVGNPPYAALSANLSPACRSVVDAYRSVAGAPLRERGMLQFEKNLQDDYVKFLALAEQAILRAGAGVVGFVTNHSFLDGPTLRGLRWSLASSFDRIRVLDLHGGTNKKEQPPGGGPDENVFAIRQGVALSLLRRTPEPPAGLAQVERADLWGTHAQKFEQLLADTSVGQPVALVAPNYYFVADGGADPAWDAAVPLTSAFVKYSTGTETGFDALLLDFERPALLRKVRAFTDRSATEARLRQRFGIRGGHAADLLARRHAFDFDAAQRYCRPLQFRPFDYRHAYLKKDLLKTNSFHVMAELSRARPGLVATRQTKERFGAFVTAGFCGHKCTSSYDRSYVFSGLAPSFLRLAEKSAGLATEALSADDLFHYLYAILSAPSYRARFAPQLSRDFPRVPLPARAGLLPKLARFGAELVALHLLADTLALRSAPVTLLGAGGDLVQAGFPRYEAERIFLNPQRWFEGVAASLWHSHIGGFQVLAKWLKDRRGRVLTRAEVRHYQRILRALAETQRVGGAIDQVIGAFGGWPAAFLSAAPTSLCAGV